MDYMSGRRREERDGNITTVRPARSSGHKNDGCSMDCRQSISTDITHYVSERLRETLQTLRGSERREQTNEKTPSWRRQR